MADLDGRPTPRPRSEMGSRSLAAFELLIDSVEMEARDRLANLGLFASAGVVWLLVWFVVNTRDPIADPSAGLIGAGLMGVAVGLTTMPLFWLAVFAKNRRIAFRGDWARAVRRGAWVGLIVSVLVVFRLQGVFQVPIAFFIVLMVIVAEATLSVER